MLSSIQVQFSGLTESEKKFFDDAVVKRSGSFWVSISCTRGGKISYHTSRKSSRAREFYEQVLESFSLVKIPSVRVSDTSQAESDQSLLRLYETLEGVLVRSVGSRKTQLQKEFEEAIAPVEALVHNVLSESVAAVASELPFRERDLGIRLPDSRHALRGMLQEAVITSKDEIEVSIAQRGTGFQSAMVLGILRYVASRSNQLSGRVVFLIEEPEAFLHPQTQRAMARILSDISVDAQLLVTTHSPVLVDSFSVRRIVRLPLSPSGMNYFVKRHELSDAEEGRLSRFCDATNSELVFANAVIFVEGYGDKLLIDHLLERITGGAGGHYALGIAVIEASSIDNIPHFLRLAQLFGVRAYVITDKDGLHATGGKKRKLIEILKTKDPGPSETELADIRNEADVRVSTLTAALAQQARLNAMLQSWDSFVLASDLEGLLLDSVGQKVLAETLGPEGENQIDKATAEGFARGVEGKAKLASWLGSKGWNSTDKTSNKSKPHLPSAILRQKLTNRSKLPRAINPLGEWLESIVAEHTRSPL